jgi:hypothetical protein
MPAGPPPTMQQPKSFVRLTRARLPDHREERDRQRCTLVGEPSNAHLAQMTLTPTRAGVPFLAAVGVALILFASGLGEAKDSSDAGTTRPRTTDGGSPPSQSDAHIRSSPAMGDVGVSPPNDAPKQGASPGAAKDPGASPKK